MPSAKSVLFNTGIKGTGAIVTKSGAGSMEMLAGNTFAQLVVKGGTVVSNESSGREQLPATVEFQGGTLNAANNESTNINNTANFVVPKSKTGTLKCGFRSTYTGRLTGEGTFNVYTGGVRCYYDGDWSEFAGTIKAYKENRQNKKSYDPIWAFRNKNGLPNATLNVQADVRVSNEGNDIEVGTVSGSGTLVGSGQWILGSNDKDFTLSTEIGVTEDRTDPYGGTIAKQASKLTKRGTGTMKLITLGKLNAALTVEGGTVTFNQSSLATFVNGTNTTTIKDGGRIAGQGKFTTLILQKGATLKPCGSLTNETTPGTIKSTVSLIVNDGAVVDFIVQDNAKYSKLEAASLTVNGTVRLTLLDGYTPAVGDELTLWTASSSFRGTPTFDLPKLPAGMAWDTTALADKTGTLRIVEADTDPYDVNGDGQVDVADISAIIDVMAGASATGASATVNADVNGDGTVDVADIASVISEMAARARRAKSAE